jgi:phage baseplate assembly protein W
MSQNLTAGIHRSTGKLLTEEAHIAQSVGDILTTPLGTRVMRENYGSLLPELLDHPQTPTLELKLMAAAFMSIIVWEPRIKPTRMRMSPALLDGRRSIDIEFALASGRSSAMQVAIGATP